MKVTLQYDENTGQLLDSGNGMLIANAGCGILFSEAAKKQESFSSDLVKLKDAGFTADEIMQMKREGLI